MKILKGLIVGIGLVMVLSACGLIPAQPVTDPFGLDGQTVEAEVGGSSTSETGLTVQASYSASGSADGSFDDFDRAPSRISNTLSITQEVTVESASAYPDFITITSINISGELSDGQESITVNNLTLPVSASFSKSASCTDGAASCTYTTSVEIPSVVLSFGSVGTVVNNGVEPNTVSVIFDLSLESTPALEAGTTISITLEASEGEVKI